MRSFTSSIAIFSSIILIASAGAQVKTKAPAAKPAEPGSVDNETLRLNAEVIRTATEYRDQLALHMKLEESEVDRLAREAEMRGQWLQKNYISRQEWEQSKLEIGRAHV